MEIGAPVYCVSASPSHANHLCVGLEDGRLLLHDVARPDAPLYAAENPESVIAVRAHSADVYYCATESAVAVHDTRAAPAPRVLFRAQGDIADIAAQGDTFAVATYSGGIALSDRRTLKRAQRGVLPAVCTSLAFSGASELVAGYIDAAVGSWNLSNAKFRSFRDGLSSGTTNPPVVHCVAVSGSLVAAARQTGLALYDGGACKAYSLFAHNGAVEAVEFARCFPEPTVVSAGADGSLMALDWKTRRVIDCFANGDEKVQCITSNEEFVAVADTSDNGCIGIFHPDDFGADEEEEEEEAAE